MYLGEVIRHAKADRWACILSGLLFCLLAAAPAFSFDFAPITQSFSPSGAGATQSFEVSNPGKQQIAVKITMVTRTMSENGTESYTPASNRFVVFPSQIVLQAGASQTVRVRWVGPADITSEQSYRIIAAQLPVNFGTTPQAGASINILFRYLGAVYIVPKGARPDVVIADARVGVGPDGKKGLFVSFRNKGTAHEILKDLTITVSGESTSGTSMSRTFDSAELKGINGANVLAGSTRAFFLPAAGELPQKGLHVDFSTH